MEHLIRRAGRMDAGCDVVFVCAHDPDARIQLEQCRSGSVASATLFTAAIGGIGFGILADRIGRKTALSFTLLLYSLASASTATVGWIPISPLLQLVFWRGLLGFGMGGEWACGAALVAEN